MFLSREEEKGLIVKDPLTKLLCNDVLDECILCMLFVSNEESISEKKNMSYLHQTCTSDL